MIYITGDTHIPIDIHKLNTRNWKEQKIMTRDDYLIICGDFGGIWNGSNEDKYWLKWFDNKNFTTLFIDGNHENHDMLNEYPVQSYLGGKVHKIKDNVYHLMRGQVFIVDGLKIFTMGGASSHDKIYRTEGKSWWKNELPTDNEYIEAFNNLGKHNWKVDLVITHCAPDTVQNQIANYYEKDKLTNFLEVLQKGLEYKQWYFGHYHIDRVVNDKFTAIYNNIVKII